MTEILSTNEYDNSRSVCLREDTVNDCACPAVAAGYNSSSGNESLIAAEWYDEMIERLEGRNLAEAGVAREIAEELDG